MTPRERFLAAVAGQPLERPPVWIMRQAGRYLPEYRALREKHDFRKLVSTPELAAEVTLQPLRRFPLDAAIIFSDILVVPEALGQGYRFRDTGGIEMEFVLENAAQIEKLDPAGVLKKLEYVAHALRLVRSELGNQTALLGFCGSPWTLATYMIEGGSIKSGEKIKNFAYAEHALFERLAEKLCEALIIYLKMQIAAGADAVQIFDSWGGLCAGNDYEKLSLKYIRRIIAALPATYPVIVYTKGMSQHAGAIAAAGAKVIGLDWTCKLSDIRAQFAGKHTPALQGNLDPVLLNTTPAIVRAATEGVLRDMHGHAGHIFNLGHGILPTAKIENVEALVETVHGWK